MKTFTILMCPQRKYEIICVCGRVSHHHSQHTRNLNFSSTVGKIQLMPLRLNNKVGSPEKYTFPFHFIHHPFSELSSTSRLKIQAMFSFLTPALKLAYASMLEFFRKVSHLISHFHTYCHDTTAWIYIKYVGWDLTLNFLLLFPTACKLSYISSYLSLDMHSYIFSCMFE